MRSPCSVCVLFELLDQLTKHYQIWYGHYATGTYPTAEIFNLFQYVKRVWMHKVLKCEVDCISSASGKPMLGSTCARYACSKYFLYHFQREKGNYEYQCHVSTQINFLTVFITGRNFCIFK